MWDFLGQKVLAVGFVPPLLDTCPTPPDIGPELLCSSINPKRVDAPLLYSKITIRVLCAATAVPTRHIADGGEKLISTATG